MANSYEINSIARAADTLKLLSQGVSRLTDIAKRLDVNKASVHRIMKTLESKGLVSQDLSTRKYYLGPLIQTLAINPIMVHQIVAQLALPEMERLRNLIDETVILQIQMGGQRLILEKVTCSHAIRYFPENLHTAPIHAGAGARILLAGLDETHLAGLLDRLELIKVGPNTITDKNQLKSNLEKIRSEGHATSFGETVAGAAGVAVLVENYSCPVALIIIGPEDRIRENMHVILKGLKDTATIISKKLAGVTGVRGVTQDTLN